MDTIQNDHNPEWTPYRTDTIPNGHDPEYTQPQMDTIPNGHDPEWTRSRIHTILNAHHPKRYNPECALTCKNSYLGVVYVCLVRTFYKSS